MKLSLLRAGSHRLSGNEFQTDGPATEKARAWAEFVDPAWRNKQE